MARGPPIADPWTIEYRCWRANPKALTGLGLGTLDILLMFRILS
jgi:hypothetical protein